MGYFGPGGGESERLCAAVVRGTLQWLVQTESSISFFFYLVSIFRRADCHWHYLSIEGGGKLGRAAWGKMTRVAEVATLCKFLKLLARMGLGEGAALEQSVILVKRLMHERLLQRVSLHQATTTTFRLLTTGAVQDVSMTERDIRLWGVDGPRIEARWFGGSKLDVEGVMEMFETRKTKLNGWVELSHMKQSFLDALEDTCWRQKALDGVMHVWSHTMAWGGVSKVVRDVVRMALIENRADADKMGSRKMKIICDKALAKWDRVQLVRSCLPGI